MILIGRLCKCNTLEEYSFGRRMVSLFLRETDGSRMHLIYIVGRGVSCLGNLMQLTILQYRQYMKGELPVMEA
jgi:hypothetical protein